MKQQAAALSKQQRVQVANYLAGSGDTSNIDRSMLMCGAPLASADVDATAVVGWGVDERNHRFIDAEIAGLNRQNVGQLKLNWVFDFPGATRTRSQPTIYDDVVYAGSQHGIVYAIDLDTGCVHWSFKADAEVRSA